MTYFRDKRIVVTGAGQGLGRSIALQFVAMGAHVLALGRTLSKLETTAERAASLTGDGRLSIHACDISVPEEVEASFSRLGEWLDHLDILINCAAIYRLMKVTEADPAAIRASIDANLLGPMLCARAAVPWMIKAGGGDIVNVSSLSVEQPRAFLPIYAATKAGLENLTDGLNRELRGKNIRVMTFRLGGMISDEPNVDFSSPLFRQFVEENAEFIKAGGGPMQHDTVLQALLTMLSLGRDALCSFMELRPFLSTVG